MEHHFQRYVMIDEVVDEFRTEWEDALIQRRDRKRTLSVLADPDAFGTETANDLFTRLRPKIEAIDLPAGYVWNGAVNTKHRGRPGRPSFSPCRWASWRCS